MATIRLSSEPNAAQSDVEHIEMRVNNFNARTVDGGDYHPIRVFLRDENGTLRGGVTADVWAGWLHITFLWVDEDLREQGYGSRLMATAEDEGRAFDCRNAYVETFSFQARPFYERFGYTVVATFEDYPPGHSHYILRKSL
jgi:ribosomal protein S18 acetylase RimI-like enzyme